MEEWRPVVGHPGYEVSSYGNVRSVDRTVPTKSGLRRYKGKVLQAFSPAKGYLRVDLGIKRPRKVAHLVLEAFVGPRPEGKVACHGLGGSDNNRVENLRWDTHQNNVIESILFGEWFSEKRLAYYNRNRSNDQ